MPDTETNAGNVNLVGGRLCLDFTNLVGRHVPAIESERLHDYSDLVAWSRHAGIFADREAQQLLREAARRPAEAGAILNRAIALRESLFRIFSALTHGSSPPTDDLSSLNAAVAEAMSHAQIMPANGGFIWGWPAGEASLDRMLWPIARSAAELLTAGKLARVRECEGDTCNWLFVDTSKNHSRRWCDMKQCGNRAKARRHYHRQRSEAAKGNRMHQ